MSYHDDDTLDEKPDELEIVLDRLEVVPEPDLMPPSLMGKFIGACAVVAILLVAGTVFWIVRLAWHGAAERHGDTKAAVVVRDEDAARRLAEAERQVAALRDEVAALEANAQRDRAEYEAKLNELSAARSQAEAALQRALDEAQRQRQPQPQQVTVAPQAPVPAPVPARTSHVSRGIGSISPRKISDEDVTAAMNRGIDALLALTEKSISSPQNGMDRQVGEVSLAVYALLTAGKLNGDPRLHFSSPEMRAAVHFVLESRPTHTYALSLQSSALSLLPKRPEYEKALRSALGGLLRGTSNGIYTYTNARPADAGDNSNTQYGQLGVWAAQDAGLEVPIWYWGRVDQYWRGTQSVAGSWGYGATFRARGNQRIDRGGGTATMTAAGVASLYLAMDQIDRSVRYQPKPDPVLDAGVRWLTENFDNYANSLSSDLYLAYGLERVALAGGIKTLGEHDWYREGAARILNVQRSDGSWEYNRGSPIVGTSYALLFLTRGIAPVACAKLQYNGPWNARARDCARFVHWLDKQTERELRWEVLDASSNVEDWRNVPILLITGHGDPNFTPDVMMQLRRYVQNGGLIFSSADVGDAEFSRAIRQKYAPFVFDRKYEMLAVGENDPAFRINYPVALDKQPRLYALSNGVRDGWIHSDDDISASWQAYTTARTAHFEVPANLYFYTGGRLKTRPMLQPLEPPAPPSVTRTITIARLDYAGNADPEPAAWSHFAAEARQRYGANVQVVPTRIADLDVNKTPIAHMTGTTRFTLSSEETRKLADFINGGGVLLADAAGGSDAFATSFKNLMATIMPQSPLDALPPDSVVYSGAMPGGVPIKTLERRPFAELGDARMRPTALLEVRYKNRPIVLFSQGDLTAGILGLKTWGIFGCTPEISSALTWNSILYLTSPPPQANTARGADQ
jgi:hypothetical protein